MSNSLKRFLMTLGATTISIVLTFGTTAIIDRKKRNAEKREMVMMIMYDMRESLKELSRVDEDLKAFFESHMDLVAHPESFDKSYIILATHYPSLDYTSTTESIFRSNIETIRTIGNILFVETVSSFYDSREKYKSIVVDSFQKKLEEAISNYESLRDFNSDAYPFYSGSIIRMMTLDFEQCKLMMKVSDNELEAFSLQQQKLEESVKGNIAHSTEKLSEEWDDRRARLQQALQEGGR